MPQIYFIQYLRLGIRQLDHQANTPTITMEGIWVLYMLSLKMGAPPVSPPAPEGSDDLPCPYAPGSLRSVLRTRPCAAVARNALIDSYLWQEWSSYAKITGSA